MSLLLPAIAALLVACGSDDRPDRTDIPQVDAVIDAVEGGDPARLRELLLFTSLPCTEVTGDPNLPRCQGEPPGTNVDVLQAFDCEAALLRREDVDALIGDVQALHLELYAAFNTPEAYYFPGRYAAVFERDDPRAGEVGAKRHMAVGIEGEAGRITGIALGCGIGDPAHFLLPHAEEDTNEDFDGYLIEPPS